MFGIEGGSYNGDALRTATKGGVSGVARLCLGDFDFTVGFAALVIESKNVADVMDGGAEDGCAAVDSDGNTAYTVGYKITATIDSDRHKAFYRVERARLSCMDETLHD